MLLSHKTTVKLNNAQSNIVGHMCYAASKLWNACNYERRNYKTLGLAQYPDWYYQKKVHKDNFWFKQLPAQTSQEVCKLLDGAWKSFYKLQKTQGILNPRPPASSRSRCLLLCSRWELSTNQDPTLYPSSSQISMTLKIIPERKSG